MILSEVDAGLNILGKLKNFTNPIQKTFLPKNKEALVELFPSDREFPWLIVGTHKNSRGPLKKLNITFEENSDPRINKYLISIAKQIYNQVEKEPKKSIPPNQCVITAYSDFPYELLMGNGVSLYTGNAKQLPLFISGTVNWIDSVGVYRSRKFRLNRVPFCQELYGTDHEILNGERDIWI